LLKEEDQHLSGADVESILSRAAMNTIPVQNTNEIPQTIPIESKHIDQAIENYKRADARVIFNVNLLLKNEVMNILAGWQRTLFKDKHIFVKYYVNVEQVMDANLYEQLYFGTMNEFKTKFPQPNQIRCFNMQIVNQKAQCIIDFIDYVPGKLTKQV
jgi:hypothetical protein